MAAPHPAFPPQLTRTGWRAAGAELLARTQDLWEVSAQVLGHDADVRPLRLPSSAAARARASAVVDTLEHGVVADVVAVATELLALADDLGEHELSRRFRQTADCERHLLRLGEVTTTADLIDGVCDEVVRAVGVQRVMLARIEAGMWRPWKANAAMTEEAWVSEWIDRAIPLDELTLETRLLSERRPELVLDTDVEGIAQMVRAAGVTTYVVAPIMPDGRVIGFLHADHGIGGRACDETDRDLLWAFAEGFGHRYEQVLLVEELQHRRERVRQAVAEITRGLDAVLDEPVVIGDEPGSDLAQSRDGHRQVAIASSAQGVRLDLLTGRELEVLELLVAGARNGEIADRLAISLATVKSHVTRVLSKLGAVNRSQLIALYLGRALEGTLPG